MDVRNQSRGLLTGLALRGRRPRARRPRLSGGVVPLVGLLVWACASQARQSGELTVPAPPDAAVAVVSCNVASTASLEAMGRDLVACLTDAVREAMPGLRVVPGEDFARVALPEAPLESAPLGPESLAALLRDPVFLARVDETGVRFLIVVGGRTTQSVAEMQGGGPGPPGVFILWDRQTDVSATIYDLRARAAAGRIEVEVSGRPWFALVGLPLGAPSFTEFWACRKLGSGVVEFLRGRPEPAP